MNAQKLCHVDFQLSIASYYHCSQKALIITNVLK